MPQDVNNWVKSCKRCKKNKGPYQYANVKQGSFIAHCPLDLFCLDFTKMDHSKDGKENILIMMDAFSSYTVAVVTANEQAKKQWAKALVHRWFYTYGIPSRIHSDQGKLFDNQIISHLSTMYGIKQSRTTHTTCGVIPNVRGFNHTLA